MRLKILFRSFLSVGSILWVVSMIGDAHGKLPESLYGVSFSFLFITIGVYLWFKSYKSQNGHFPRFLKVHRELNKEMRKNPLSIIWFLARNLLKFYTCILIFSMALVFLGHVSIRLSKPFITTHNYMTEQFEISKNTGKIKIYGVLMTGSTKWNSKTGNSDITFSFLAENGIYDVTSKLEKKNGKWIVQKLELKNKNTGANTVYN